MQPAELPERFRRAPRWAVAIGLIGVLAYVIAMVVPSRGWWDAVAIAALVVGLTVMLTPMLVDTTWGEPRRRPALRLALPLAIIFGLLPALPFGFPTLAAKGRFANEASNVWSIGKGADERIFLWRLDPGNETGEVIAMDTRGRKQFSIPLRNVGQQMRSSADGRWLVVSSKGAGAFVYDRAGRQVGQLPGETQAVAGDRFVQAVCDSSAQCAVKIMNPSGQLLTELPARSVIPVDVSTDTHFRYGSLPTVAAFTDPDWAPQLVNPADASVRPLGAVTSADQSEGHLMTYTFGRITLDGRELHWPADLLGTNPNTVRLGTRVWLAGERVFVNVDSKGSWVWQQDHWRQLPGQPRKYRYTDQTDGRLWVSADLDSRTVNGVDLETGRTWTWRVPDFDEEFIPKTYYVPRTKAEDDDDLLGVHVREGTVAVTYQSRGRMPGRHPGTTVQLLDAQTGARRAKTWGTPATDYWRVYPMAKHRAVLSYWGDDSKDHGMILG